MNSKDLKLVVSDVTLNENNVKFNVDMSTAIVVHKPGTDEYHLFHTVEVTTPNGDELVISFKSTFEIKNGDKTKQFLADVLVSYPSERNEDHPNPNQRCSIKVSICNENTVGDPCYPELHDPLNIDFPIDEE